MVASCDLCEKRFNEKNYFDQDNVMGSTFFFVKTCSTSGDLDRISKGQLSYNIIHPWLASWKLHKFKQNLWTEVMSIWLHKNFICVTQCGNFIIFLSLRFYVKPILEMLTSAQSAILTHVQALYFDFYDFLHFLKVRITNLTKFRTKNCEKWQF